MRIVLLVGQTALCMLMLSSAGAFLQSLRRAGDVDLGFDRDKLIVVFDLYRLPPAGVHDVMDRIRVLPSVAGVSQADFDLLGAMGGSIVMRDGRILSPDRAPVFGHVDVAYARAVGLKLLRGRLLGPEDAARADQVAVISSAMADAFWPGRDPIGDCFHQGTLAKPCRRIVGIVQQVRWDVTTPPRPLYYLPMPDTQSRCCSVVIVRTRLRATVTDVAAIRRIIAGLPGSNAADPPNPRLLSERHAPIMRPWRIAASLFFAFGLLALVAAAAGIYGLVAYDVTQRTHELGVRITLGATSSSIAHLVLSSGLRVILIGLVVGSAAAIAGGRVFASLLFETSPYDPAVLGATAATLAVAALLAGVGPAWRATRVDPVVALRAE